MNKQDQLIALAEYDGYIFKDEGWRYPDEPDWQKYKAVYRGDGFIGLSRPDWTQVPNYFEDVRIVRNLVQKLDSGNRGNFAHELYRVYYNRVEMPMFDADYYEPLINATAEQWSETFLKLQKLWID